MVTKLLLLTILYLIGFGTEGLAPFVTKCRLSDAECLTTNAARLIPLFAAGIPELGVERLDPLFLDRVNASKLNLNFMVYEANLEGLRNCKPLLVHMNSSDSLAKIIFNTRCSVELHGQYELSGSVLALNINGRGIIHAYLPLFDICVETDFSSFVGENGKKYIKTERFKYAFNLIDKSEVIFMDLFQNNKVLSNATATLIRNSGNQIVKEIGDPIFHASVSHILKSIHNFFISVPFEELSYDEL